MNHSIRSLNCLFFLIAVFSIKVQADQMLEVGQSYNFAQTPQSTVPYQVQIPAAGELTIHLNNWHSTFDWGTATSQAFTMSISAVYCPDAYEPNETMASATPLLLNSILTAYPWRQVNISSVWGDEDWYKVDVPSPGMLQINLSNWIGVYDWIKDFDRLYVYNAAGTSSD